MSAAGRAVHSHAGRYGSQPAAVGTHPAECAAGGNDGVFPNLPTAARLARVLGVTLNGLLDGSSDLEPAALPADATAQLQVLRTCDELVHGGGPDVGGHV